MTVGRRGSCPNPNIPLAGLRMVYPFFFFTMKEGAANDHVLFVAFAE